MARVSVSTTPSVIVQNAASTTLINQSDDWSGRSSVIFSPSSTGTVLLMPGPLSAAPDMTDAARWDFSRMALNYACEAGVALWAKTTSGTVSLDVLEGGER